MNSVLCVADVGVRRFVPDKFVFGVLGFGDLGFWAWEEFWGQIVTDVTSKAYIDLIKVSGFI